MGRMVRFSRHPNVLSTMKVGLVRPVFRSQINVAVGSKLRLATFLICVRIT